MNGKNIKIVVALLAGLTFGITGCTGDQVSPDRVYLDADGNSNGDGPRLCQSVADCLAGEDCQDGVCVSATSCNCNYDCDKTANEVCNQATHECETGAPPVNCLNDCDCYSGKSCISGACQPTGGDERTCTIDEECEEDEVCKNGKCVPLSCTTREDCAGAVCLICQDGECTAPPPVCQGNDHCCVGFYCNFGTCVPESTGDCLSDADCTEDPDFPRCVDGNCVQECINDIDCPLPGQVCLDNHCVTPGCTPETCNPGEWCDTGDGVCKPGCDSNDDCVPPETCNYVSHTCGQTDCCGGCSGDQYCDTLSCLCVDKCSLTNPCPTGFECRADGKCWCTDAGCPAGTHCDPGTGDCVQDTVECNTNDDCPAGWTCNLATNLCESSGGLGDGDMCFQDANCDQAAGLLCDSSLFCFGCIMADEFFNPTFTCRFECSLLFPQCAGGYECLYRHLGLIGLCMPI
ncbi:MAG: hypothetical protein JRJ19_01780 [Deltaproteobacteria bacterium]|nr:hypothetical protein [Deltaproteobacteria bacterium]